MSTDFFDDDLLQKDDESSDGQQGEDVEKEAANETSAAEMTRHKEELSSKMAGATRELELLRRKQESLEKNKSALEELSRKQDVYDRDKKAMIEKLRKGVVLLEKEQVQASRMEELFGQTRKKFKEMLSEVEGIDESQWSNEHFSSELEDALSVVENARLAYNKALSRIEATSWHKGTVDAPARAEAPPSENVSGVPGNRFATWLKLGVAFSLPFGALLVLLFVAWLWATGFFRV